jgi:hypothetical protein
MIGIALSALLSITLLVGFVAGWFSGKALRVTMPNAFVAAAVLATGSLGGPIATYWVLGARALSYVVALLVAGWTAGLVFWPMGQPQESRQWF